MFSLLVQNESKIKFLPLLRRCFFDRPWSGVDAFHADLVYDLYVQVVVDPYLTRKPRVIAKVRLGRKDRSLGFADLARVATQNFNAARRTACIAAAAMQNVDTIVLNFQNQFAAFVCFESDGPARGFGSNSWH
jgi:hypothetical protein